MFYIITTLEMIDSTLPMTHKSFEKVHKKVEILDQVIDWKITEVQAWIELWVTDRWIRKLLKKYKNKWEEWLIHWSLWKSSHNHIKASDRKIIVDVIKQDDFKHCKPKFITEKLGDDYWIWVSKETVRNVMIEEKIRIKGTKKHHIYRTKRPRKDSYWEMSQFDWSYHKWFEERWEEACLLLDVDDATSDIMHAKLWDNEWYKCVVEFRKEYICIHGIPRSIYLDKFSTYKVNHWKAVNTKDVRTNFDRSMKKLWCNLISANSPEAKWRVEKCNHTLQDRLVWELRLAKISTIEEANVFIKNIFIPKFNKQFWVIAKSKWNLHIVPTKEQLKNLDRIFAKEELRSLWQDYVIQYKNKFYQTEQSKEYTIYPKKRLLVGETIYWELRIYAWKTSEEKLVVYHEIDYNTTKRNRAMYRNQKHKIEKERFKQAVIDRKATNHQLSKKRQIYYKAQRLIDNL